MKHFVFNLYSIHTAQKLAYFPLIFIQRTYAALPKRFYRKVDIIENDDNSYEITLDQRKLKTSQGNVLKLHNKALALAVAAEWDGQKETIERSSMHLTALCNTVIDNPCQLDERKAISNLLNYLETDAILYHCSENNELYRVQLQEWNPVINWFNERYQVNVSPSRDLNGTLCDAHSVETMKRHLQSYTFPCLHGLSFAVENLKSLILTLCCTEQYISIERAVFLSRLEEEFQTEKWGRVEWAHDINYVDLQSRVSAALTFIRLHFESTKIYSK